VPAVAATVIRPCDVIVQPVLVVIVMTPEPEPSTLTTVKSKHEPTLTAFVKDASSVATVGRVYAAADEPGEPSRMPFVICAAVSVASPVAVAGAGQTPRIVSERLASPSC